jgi:hypothetical protein
MDTIVEVGTQFTTEDGKHYEVVTFLGDDTVLAKKIVDGKGQRGRPRQFHTAQVRDYLNQLSLPMSIGK